MKRIQFMVAVLPTPAGEGAMRVRVDGIELRDEIIPLAGDHQGHRVEARSPGAGG